MAHRQWNLLSYDVRDDARRQRVARLLEGYGERVQFSVFRVHCSPRQLMQIRSEAARVLSDQDSLLVIPVPDSVARRIQTLQGPRDWVDEARRRYVIVG